MKLNYSENQYEQLAKEQLCRTFNNIPFVSDVEIITITERDYGFDFYALVHYSDIDEVEKLYVNVKSNGEKRFVNLFQHNEICGAILEKFTKKENIFIRFVQEKKH